MKTKEQKNSINIVTLGCSKNIVDSERLSTQLIDNNRQVFHDSNDQHDIVIINTCGFIENAKQESIDTILAFADAKSKGTVKQLFVTGCLSERYKVHLKEEIELVDGWFGTMDQPELLKALHADFRKELLDYRSIITPAHYAYLKISEGCDRPCSFCAIPIMRGKHRSKPIEHLVKEATHLVSKGVKEILIIAQDSTYYGLDLYKKRALSELLRHLSDVEGLEWIRLHYAFPSSFPMDVLDVMSQKSNICNYLDIPLQHGSTKMLQLMRRGTTREKTEQLLADIRHKMPEITIRTTLIVGYPQESEQDFEDMMTFVEQQAFDRLGAFTYSHEEGTHAFKMEDDVSAMLKEERLSQIMELQADISGQKNQEKLNTVQRVLIDSKQQNYYIGRTQADSPEVDNEVYIVGKNNNTKIGNFVDVKIDKADTFDLFGSIIK